MRAELLARSINAPLEVDFTKHYSKKRRKKKMKDAV